MRRDKNERRSGFSMIEGAMVFTAVGLIAGAIVAGKSIVRASEIQSVSSDMQAYTSAVNTFQLKYKYLPGDMSTAETIWGSATYCGPYRSGPQYAGDNTAKTTTTCNGDGNGQIGFIDMQSSTVTQPTEFFRAWQQMADAGLIPGQYTGVSGPNSDNDVVPGLNTPLSKVQNGGWYLFSGQASASGTTYPFPSGVVLQYGAITDPVNSPTPGAPILTPQETFALDSKMDDGNPATGSLLAQPPSAPNSPNCATSSNPATAHYNLAYTEPGCAFMEIVN